MRARPTGETVTRGLLTRIEEEEAAAIRSEIGEDASRLQLLDQARALFAELLDAQRLPEFLTLRAYDLLP